MYKITITKFVDNPKYDEEMVEYKEKTRYGYNVQYPKATLEERVLESSFTDEEFKAVKKAVLEIM